MLFNSFHYTSITINIIFLILWNFRPRPSPAIKKDGDSNKVDEDVERGVTDDMNLVSKITCDICGFEMTKVRNKVPFKDQHMMIII